MHYKAVQRGICEAWTLLIVLPTRKSFAAAFYYYPVCKWKVINEWWNEEFWLFGGLSIQKECTLQLFLNFLFVIKQKVLFVVFVWFLLEEKCDIEIRSMLHSPARFTTMSLLRLWRWANLGVKVFVQFSSLLSPSAVPKETFTSVMRVTI